MERCSFCGKHQDDVAVMVQGPATNICDECVGLCLETIAAYMRDGATKLRHFIEQGD